MLTDIQVRKAEPRERPYKLFDGQGLFVFVTVKGHKSWRLKYKAAGQEKLLVLGSYPAMSLKDAREAVTEIQRKRREGVDPVLAAKRLQLVAKSDQHTFEEMALRWHTREKKHWRPVHADDVLKSMKRDLFPDLGSFPLGQIDRPLLLAVLQKVEKRGAVETAHRLRQRCEATSTSPSPAAWRATIRQPAWEVRSSAKRSRSVGPPLWNLPRCVACCETRTLLGRARSPGQLLGCWRSQRNDLA